MATSSPAESPESGVRWVSLSEASRLLGVSQGALRLWADQGQVRSFRTPGGHRRFAQDDLASLVQVRPAADPATGSEHWRDKALSGMRRRVQTRRSDHTSWFSGMDDSGRDRMRLLGRQLMALVADAVDHPRARAARQTEARSIGTGYGHEGVSNHLPLGDLLQAFVFFRASLDETARALVRRQRMTPTQVVGLWQQTDSLLDAVLLAAVAVYEGAAAAPVDAAPVSPH